MKPTPRHHGWKVWTDREAFASGYGGQNTPRWHWAAWGDRGYESGCEVESRHATDKAMGAHLLLAHPEQQS